jgi:hypothetical protein
LLHRRRDGGGNDGDVKKLKMCPQHVGQGVVSEIESHESRYVSLTLIEVQLFAGIQSDPGFQ